MIFRCAFLFLFFGGFMLQAQNYKKLLNFAYTQQYAALNLEVNTRLAKHPTDPILLYLKARTLGVQQSLLYNPEKAYKVIRSAIAIPPTARQLKRFRGAGGKLSDFTVLKEQLSAAAWQVTLAALTTEAVEKFLTNYPEAVETPYALKWLEEQKWHKAVEDNTVQGFETYISNYPKGMFINAANAKLAEFYMEEARAAGTPQAYKQYLSRFSEGLARQQAEQALLVEVFLLKPAQQLTFAKLLPSTKAASIAWLESFLATPNKVAFLADNPDFPNSNWAKRYSRTASEPAFIVLADSSTSVVTTNGEVLSVFKEINFPFVKSCDIISSEPLIYTDAGGKSKKGLTERNGLIRTPAKYDSLTRLNNLLYQYTLNNKKGLLHRSGVELTEALYQELQLLPKEKFLVKQDNKWGVTSVKGEELIKPEWAQVQFQNDSVVVLSNINRAIIFGTSFASDNKYIYQKVIPTSSGEFIVANAQYYGLINATGEQVLPLRYPNISEFGSGFLVETLQGFKIYDNGGHPVSALPYKNVIAVEAGLLVKAGDFWGMLSKTGQLVLQPLYDTIMYAGADAVVATRNQQRFLYLPGFKLSDVSRFTRLNVRTTKRHPYLIQVENAQGKQGLISPSGESFLPTKFTSIQPMGGAFMVQQKNKRGLVSELGEELLPAVYDGIVQYDSGYYTTLSSGLFGIYNANSKKSLAPQFTALPKKLSPDSEWFIVKKQHFGVINLNGKQLLPFEYSEIYQFGKEKLLLKKEGTYQLYNCATQQTEQITFSNFRPLLNSPEASVIRTYNRGKFGLLSSKYGKLAAEEYTDISVVDKPEAANALIFILEKATNHAGQLQVTYMAANGEVLAKTTVSAEAFSSFYCE